MYNLFDDREKRKDAEEKFNKSVQKHIEENTCKYHISTNVINCFLGMMAGLLMFFNFFNSKSMISLFCIVGITVLLVYSSIDKFNRGKYGLFIARLLISILLFVKLICDLNQTPIYGEDISPSILYNAIINHGIDIFLIQIIFYYFQRFKGSYIFTIVDAVNIPICWFHIY